MGLRWRIPSGLFNSYGAEASPLNAAICCLNRCRLALCSSAHKTGHSFDRNSYRSSSARLSDCLSLSEGVTVGLAPRQQAVVSDVVVLCCVGM